MASHVVNGYTTPAGVNSKEQVMQLQQQLNSQGANLVVDGIYGAKTDAAYKSTSRASSQAPKPSSSSYGTQSGSQTNYNSSQYTNSTASSKVSSYLADARAQTQLLITKAVEKAKESVAKKKESANVLVTTADPSLNDKSPYRFLPQRIQDVKAAQQKEISGAQTVPSSQTLGPVQQSPGVAPANPTTAQTPKFLNSFEMLFDPMFNAALQTHMQNTLNSKGSVKNSMGGTQPAGVTSSPSTAKPAFAASNNGSTMGGYMNELRDYLAELPKPEKALSSENSGYGSMSRGWNASEVKIKPDVLSEARKVSLPEISEMSNDEQRKYNIYRNANPLPNSKNAWDNERNLTMKYNVQQRALEQLMDEGDRNFPRYDTFDRIREQEALVNETGALLSVVRENLKGREFDPNLNRANQLLVDYKTTHSAKQKFEAQMREGGFSIKSLDPDTREAYNKLCDASSEALIEYASFPIVLTDETLRNPIALKHADALSIRMAISDDDKQTINNAMRDVSGIIERYRREGKTAEMLWAFDVYAALEAKSTGYAVAMGALNNQTYNLAQMASASAIAGYKPGSSGCSSLQLLYMSGTYGIEAANPLAYNSGGDMALVGSSLNSAFGFSPDYSGILRPEVKSTIEYILEEIAGDSFTKEASKRYE